jgi:hypothetical protein
MTTATTDLKNGLANFYGSENMYRHSLNRRMVYTDGVRYFAQEAGGGAYWFLDILATEGANCIKPKEDQNFVSVNMTVKDSKAVIKFTDGNDTVYHTRDIEYTDCPEGEWKFFMIYDGESTTVLLPSEY